MASRVLLVFATVALAYSNYPSWVDYPDAGSIAIIFAIAAMWAVAYVWWYRRLVTTSGDRREVQR